MSGFDYAKDGDGIVTVTMDMAGQATNTMNAAYRELMAATMNRLEAEKELTGVIFTSGKKTFFAGGDLNALLAQRGADAAYFDYIEENKLFFRRLERLPVPVVAAINGAALGGGYELCLACNLRILVDGPDAVVGLPEVSLGLLPGAGGVVRLVAHLGLEKALPWLLEGEKARPAQALSEGLVDDLVADAEELIPRANAWIKANPSAHAQPWDRPGFVHPGGGAEIPKVRQIATMAPTALIKKTRGLLPAPGKILDVAVNSMRMGFDSALRNESRAFLSLVVSPEAKAAISTFFFGMNGIRSGRARPQGAKSEIARSIVIGAGMMGAGVAYVQAAKGIEVQLVDTSLEAAEKGKAAVQVICGKLVERGRMQAEAAEALLGRIRPVVLSQAEGCVDLIIEAVFEDFDLKSRVIADSFTLLASDGIFGTNTSTLPVSLLAESCPEPTRFVGMHFFSPVERMELVELITGEKTSTDTLRRAYDHVLQLGKVPIVVSDSRGFFTSRVFSTYTDEGAALLRDGVDPVVIERGAHVAGMPVGPLAVSDEVSLSLQMKIFETHRSLDARLGVKDGFPTDHAATLEVTGALAEKGRIGRKSRAGFYDYHADGSKTLWPGLAELATGNGGIDFRTVQDRLIYRQVCETLRCYDEGVLHSEIEADLGSILGIGFPAHTGGALRFIHGVGIGAFAARAAELAAAFGPRFAVTQSALDKLALSVTAAA
ncbi:3-hydroxyacyl-CoA dehydrogenase NAD-binding domain-containing protein [Xanthobacter versatilis]|uniref:3-hydroxyacyl-CoA dehydrogenase NAD-binding domain-containing protein n=1 Tax=Xanthobacter autotrophicus (strain ATCC BAA-1158 / Py2) TaxID=78245 RepID=UPI00372B2734